MLSYSTGVADPAQRLVVTSDWQSKLAELAYAGPKSKLQLIRYTILERHTFGADGIAKRDSLHCRDSFPGTVLSQSLEGWRPARFPSGAATGAACFLHAHVSVCNSNTVGLDPPIFAGGTAKILSRHPCAIPACCRSAAPRRVCSSKDGRTSGLMHTVPWP